MDGIILNGISRFYKEHTFIDTTDPTVALIIVIYFIKEGYSALTEEK